MITKSQADPRPGSCAQTHTSDKLLITISAGLQKHPKIQMFKPGLIIYLLKPACFPLLPTLESGTNFSWSPNHLKHSLFLIPIAGGTEDLVSTKHQTTIAANTFSVLYVPVLIPSALWTVIHSWL